MTLDDIHGPQKSNVNGIGAWAAQGIVGRGVLLDHLAWRKSRGVEVARHDAFKTGAIPLSELKEVAAWEGVEIKFGDVLFIRSGFIAAHSQMDREELEVLRKQMPPGFYGVEQSEELLKWVWENFSAVAGDQPSFESWRGYRTPIVMHRLLTHDSDGKGVELSRSLPGWLGTAYWRAVRLGEAVGALC